jgi:enediyne polyketide synthase
VLRHRTDGRPEVDGGPRISIAHAGGLVLAVSRRGAVGCDLEPVVARPAADWRGLLGDERWALARLLSDEETADAAATRVWAAAEALVKAGAPAGAPLTLEAASDDGWLILRSGRYRVATAAPVLRGLGRAAVAVVIEADERATARQVPWATPLELPALAGGGDA